MGGYVFTGVCLFNFRGGYSIPGLDGGGPHPRSGWGVPHPRSGWGGTPFQVWSGVYPILPGVPPHPRLDGVPPIQYWMGYPPSNIGWGTPSPIQDWMGYPPTPHPDLGQGVAQVPPPPISKTSTCYAAGGVPLAFTQEDFLVLLLIILCVCENLDGIHTHF